MKETSDRIKSAILNSKLTYRELEEKTGIPRSAIHRYGSGFTDNIPIDRLEKLAKALGTTPAYLLGWTDYMDAEDAEFIQSLGYIHPLDELPEDVAALNVFLYEIGEKIIRTNGKYYLGECGEITEEELKRLKTASVTSLKVAYDMLLAERRKELRRRLSGEF